MSKKLFEALSITLVVAMLLSSSAFASTTDKSQKALIAAVVIRITDEIKSGNSTDDDVSRLIELANEGSIVAGQAIFSFDCFNEDIAHESLEGIKLAANTEEKFTFDDGSYILVKNVTTPAYVSLTSLTDSAYLLTAGYPTPPNIRYSSGNRYR